MRLNHYLAKAGVGSRREAERLMADGKVRVNGQPVPAGGVDVTDGDVVTVDGKRVAPAEAPLPRIFIYHKPAGPIVTANDPQGRTTIWDLLPTHINGVNLPRLMTVGRLDANSEGLLLLTSDGALAQRLMSPDTALEREYRVRVFGALEDKQLTQIRAGVKVRGVQYRGATIREETGSDKAVVRTRRGQMASATPREATEGKSNHWYRVILTEGKNREIRKIFSHYRSTVNRLIRVRYGIFMLKDMPKGLLVEVPGHIVKKFIDGLDKPQPVKAPRAAGRAAEMKTETRPTDARRAPRSAPKVRVLNG